MFESERVCVCVGGFVCVWLCGGEPLREECLCKETELASTVVQSGSIA